MNAIVFAVASLLTYALATAARKALESRADSAAREDRIAWLAVLLTGLLPSGAVGGGTVLVIHTWGIETIPASIWSWVFYGICFVAIVVLGTRWGGWWGDSLSVTHEHVWTERPIDDQVMGVRRPGKFMIAPRLKGSVAYDANMIFSGLLSSLLNGLVLGGVIIAGW